MDAVLQWGLTLIQALQADRNEALDAFFRAITQLGGVGHVFIIPFVLWSLSYRAGLRLLIALLLSLLINFGAKDIGAQPRPFDLDPAIGPDREVGPGLPSGHAQHTLVEWGMIAAWVGQRWFTVLATTLILLIAFSRLWLGVHFPTDILGGWLLGGAILWIALRRGDTLAAWIGAHGALWQAGLATCVSLLFIGFYLLLPQTPYLIGFAGQWLGAMLGAILCLRRLQPPEGGAAWQRLLRYVLGMVVLLLWMGQAGKWMPEQHAIAWFIAAFSYNFIGGLWLTAGAPALFQILRLSPRDDGLQAEPTG